MLNSLTHSAHNTLPSSQVSKFLTGALLLAAAALTGCSSTSASSDISRADVYVSAPADTARAFVPNHHHANVRDLSRVELSPRQLAAVHTL